MPDSAPAADGARATPTCGRRRPGDAWAALVVIGYGWTLTQPADAMGVFMLPLVVAVVLLMAIPAFRLLRGARVGPAAFGAASLLLGLGVLGGWSGGDAFFSRGVGPSPLEVVLIVAVVLSGVLAIYWLRRVATVDESGSFPSD